ncbi:DMT family transporter [Falsihalocynthiibacter sp. SS001]|uniref:DMT family transporter n=1 Tax=Falsihalocynthiibacter sp. SS001 TaxID=3349698 RepID=UPI0036D26A6F
MLAQAGAKNWIRIALLGVIWGASFMVIEIAITGFSALWVGAIRVTVAAIVLMIVTLISGSGLPSLEGPRAGAIWLCAFCFGILSNALPFTLLAWGQAYVTSGFAGVSMAAVPLMVLPLAHFFVEGDRLTPRKATGFAIGFAGVFLLVGQNAFVSSGNSLETWGRLACLLTAVSYACGSIVTRVCPPVPYKSFSAAAMLMASVTALIVALWFDGVPQKFPTIPLLSVVYLGVVPTALTTLLLVAVAREAGPSFLGLSNYMVPVWSVIFGVTLLNETMPPMLLPALALILIGVAISQKWRA